MTDERPWPQQLGPDQHEAFQPPLPLPTLSSTTPPPVLPTLSAPLPASDPVGADAWEAPRPAWRPRHAADPLDSDPLESDPLESDPLDSDPAPTPSAEPPPASPPQPAVDQTPVATADRPAARGPARHRAQPEPARPARASRRAAPGSTQPRPAVAMPALVVLTLVAAFFAWASADPFWLSLGRGHSTIATVTSADCQATTEVFPTQEVTLVNTASCAVGDRFEVRVLAADSTRAYATDTTGLTLRWVVGFALIIVCGLAIALLSGAFRFAGRQRAAVAGASVSAPVVLSVAILAFAFA